MKVSYLAQGAPRKNNKVKTIFTETEPKNKTTKAMNEITTKTCPTLQADSATNHGN